MLYLHLHFCALRYHKDKQAEYKKFWISIWHQKCQVVCPQLTDFTVRYTTLLTCCINIQSQIHMQHNTTHLTGCLQASSAQTPTHACTQSSTQHQLNIECHYSRPGELQEATWGTVASKAKRSGGRCCIHGLDVFGLLGFPNGFSTEAFS